MADLFTAAVTSSLAKKAGIPQPTRLRRYEPGAPLLEGPVVVLGGGRFTGQLTEALGAEGVTVLDAAHVTSAGDGGDRLGAVVADLSEVGDPAGLSVLRDELAPLVKRLAKSARVVVVGTDPGSVDGVARVAAQRALEGFTRSLGKELRFGSTANLVLAQADSVAATSLDGGLDHVHAAAVDASDSAAYSAADSAADGVWSAVEFLLSGRSAYVDGQAVRVGSSAAPAPVVGDRTRPLAGKVAVVTGAARGIGAEIAQVMARDGATVVCVDIPAAGDALARVANEVRGTALQLDVTLPEAGERIVEHARTRHGGIDIVVHNAGITRDKLFVNMDESRWDSVMSVNLQSVIAMNEVLLADGGLGQGGRIVCVASIAGIAGNRGQTNYGASKAGIIGVVSATAPLAAGRGVTVNAVAPGFIETEMTARIPFATREVGRRMNSLQQGGRPRDVAETIAWLAQPGAGAVTGQVLRVCGQSMLGA